MLIDEIKKANVEAMKARDNTAKGIYSIIMNKYMLLSIEKKQKGEEATDVDLITIISKTLKELTEEKESYLKVNNLEKVNAIAHQEELISKYLPKMLTEEEIRKEISTLDDKSLPNVMKHFKTNFQGKVDMGLVSKIARS
jgi:gatB/yqey domain protein